MKHEDFPRKNAWLSVQLWAILGGESLESFRACQAKIPKKMAGALRMLSTKEEPKILLQFEGNIYTWQYGCWEMEKQATYCGDRLAAMEKRVRGIAKRGGIPMVQDNLASFLRGGPVKLVRMASCG